MQKVFPACWHLMAEWQLPQNSFLANGNSYDVPTVFQVWKRMETARQQPAAAAPEGWSFVKSTDAYDLAFRRVGGRAGQCFPAGDWNPQCFYFIKFDATRTASILEKMNSVVYEHTTVGPRSLSKSECAAPLNGAWAEGKK